MNDTKLTTVEKVREFLRGSQVLEFEGVSKEERYRWIERELVRFTYMQLPRKDKGVIRQYLEKISGYSRAQVCRLIKQYTKQGRLRKATGKKHRFSRKYTPSDIAVLAQTDKLHHTLSGPATKKIMEREWAVYGNADFRNIAHISVAHLYNLRRSRHYQRMHTHYTRTTPVVVNIGERVKPEPEGKPGYIRVDTVHQGDLNGAKGVYHINAVDESIQWEIVASVERISEAYLEPVLESMLEDFPFVLRGFHSDNGSEFVNKTVAKLLNKLLIRFTKCRPRHTNDNGLVETKNGAVVRKHLGYTHIPQACASVMNQFHREYLNIYLNFHRPCFFPVAVIDDRGRIKKQYPYEQVMTPYEKLKSLPEAHTYLQPGVTFEQLDDIAHQMSDNAFAERMVKARSNLFQQISKYLHRGA